jgi:histidinol-phosphatase (PHP family)
VSNKNFYDSHIHSQNSHDGNGSVKSLCEEAIKRGALGIAITDHCDIKTGKNCCKSVKQALMTEIKEARERFAEKLEITAGIEIGEPHHNLALARELAGDDKLDFVIGSLHQLRDEHDFKYIDYDHVDLDYIFRKYMDELLELSESGCYDVIGHINYQVRYMNANQRERLDIAQYYPEVSRVIESAVRHGKGIEVNTSGRNSGCGNTLPYIEVVRMFKSSGGEIITAGSDSHGPFRIGDGIYDAMETLRLAGFEKFAFFKGRKPKMLDIPV